MIWVCKKVAEMYAGKDWHTLSSEEHEIVMALEKAGFLEKVDLFRGFVGEVHVGEEPEFKPLDGSFKGYKWTDGAEDRSVVLCAGEDGEVVLGFGRGESKRHVRLSATAVEALTMLLVERYD